MSDTPKTDAVQGGLECATERPEDWEKCFQWMAGHARSLERELESTKRLLNFWKSAFHESRVVARVEDTPITDAAVVRFTVASEIDRSPAGEWVAAGVARGLEQERNAVLADIRNADDQLMRWFKAASPYATPGSLESGLDRLRACENALMDLYEANAKGVFSVPDKHYSLITAAAEVLQQDSLAVIAALRRKGWNSAIRRAAEVAEHYAKLMKSEAAQRVADEIRAMKSEP
jgi:hypothetical protein